MARMVRKDEFKQSIDNLILEIRIVIFFFTKKIQISTQLAICTRWDNHVWLGF